MKKYLFGALMVFDGSRRVRLLSHFDPSKRVHKRCNMFVTRAGEKS
jgi:hypothetical protein